MTSPRRQPFDPVLFCRRVLERGVAIGQDTVTQARGDEEHTDRIETAARQLAADLNAHLGAGRTG